MRMLRLTLSIFSVVLIQMQSIAQSSLIKYKATIKREDGRNIVFNIDESKISNRLKWMIRNADETIDINEIKVKGDSLLVSMPFFGAELFLKKTTEGYKGQWKKAGSKGDVYMPLEIVRGTGRYMLPPQQSKMNLTGRWRAVFQNAQGEKSEAIAELKQVGPKITGSILTTTGDYRYLQGSVNKDSLVMSTFDGTHAFYFSAQISKEGKLQNGIFASGPTSLETWSAVRDAQVELDESDVLMRVKDPAQKLNFKFPDLDGNMVSINDVKFKGKVIVIQIMGSWCPNCMDETAFLSNYYREQKDKGFEVIGLAYEYTTDFVKAKTSLSRFKNKFNVEYPMLITGVISNDPLRTEKTLPQFTPIKAFPSMIILGRDGTVRKTHAGYAGPATGVHHENFKKEFEAYISELLKES